MILTQTQYSSVSTPVHVAVHAVDTPDRRPLVAIDLVVRPGVSNTVLTSDPKEARDFADQLEAAAHAIRELMGGR